MQPRISIITLGVNNLEKSLAFYRDGLGLQTNGIIGTEFKGDEPVLQGQSLVRAPKRVNSFALSTK